MALIDDSVKEVIDSNKAKARQDQSKMRKEIKEFVDNCPVFNLQKIFSLVKEIKRNRTL